MLSKVASKSSLQSRSGILIRKFSHGMLTAFDVLKVQHSKMQYHKTAGVGDSLSRWCLCGGSTRQFRWVSNPVAVMAPTGGFVRSITSLTLKVGSSDVIYKGNFSSTLQPCTHKRFSTNADMLVNQDLDMPENQDLDMPRSYEIGMPPLCLTRNEVNIVKWVKKVGDRIYPGDVICEVETDRGVVEFETIEDGYLAKIIKGDGTQGIKPGEVIGLAVEEEADIEKLKNNELFESESDVPESNEPSEPEASERSEAPALASDTQNISKPSVDIEDYSASQGKEAQTTPAKDAEGVGLDFTDVPHTQIGKVTAARLLMSKQTIPHYYMTVDTCVDKLMELRSQLNSLQEASGGKRISVNDIVIKAAALALKKVPACNSSWTNDYIRQYHSVNINVAVQTDNGLYVPVVRDADKKSLSKISEEVGTLAQKARENSLKPEECEGGTFTVSNLGGPFGTKQFCAIINPPQAAILAIGTAEKRVVPGIGADPYKLSSFMSVALSCDHRVIDGAIGAEWLKAFKGYIENPESMML